MSKKKSLTHLPAPSLLHTMMADLGAVWEQAEIPGMTEATKPHGATLPLPGGYMTLSHSETIWELRFQCWPYQDVVLTRTDNSSQWSISEDTDRKATNNAWKMTKPLFMSDEVLLEYIVKSLSIRGITAPFVIVEQLLELRFNSSSRN